MTEGLLGTNPPDFKSFFFDASVQESEFYRTVQSQHGVKYIGSLLTPDKSLSTRIAIEGLTAETRYQIYLYIIDKGGNLNQIPEKLEFDTLPRDDASFIEITFSRNYLRWVAGNTSFNERAEVAQHLNFAMCLPESSVTFETVSLPKTLSSSFIWSPASQSSSSDFNISFPKTSESGSATSKSPPNWALFKTTSDSFYFKSPIEAKGIIVTEDVPTRISDSYARYLGQAALQESFKVIFQVPGLKRYPNYPSSPDLISSYFFSKLDKFKSAFPIFDEGSILNIYNYNRYSLDFVVLPVALNISENSFDVRIRTTRVGRAYLMVIEKSLDLGKPFGFQVQMGLDKFNQPRLHGRIDVTSEYTVSLNLRISKSRSTVFKKTPTTTYT